MSVAGCSDAMNLDDTTLTLGLPGGMTRGRKLVMKRVFSEIIDLNLGRGSSEDGDAKVAKASGAIISEAIIKSKLPPPAAKMQAIGWPPVKLPRKNSITKSCKFVKVAFDGAPYLRKVDLETYNNYEQLLDALENMFSCFTIRMDSNERKLMDQATVGEYMPTYEDKDNDWMLVGDVPWKTFVDSCKRIRLMKSSEEIGLAAPRGYSVSTCTSSCS